MRTDRIVENEINTPEVEAEHCRSKGCQRLSGDASLQLFRSWRNNVAFGARQRTHATSARRTTEQRRITNAAAILVTPSMATACRRCKCSGRRHCSSKESASEERLVAELAAEPRRTCRTRLQRIVWGFIDSDVPAPPRCITKFTPTAAEVSVCRV